MIFKKGFPKKFYFSLLLLIKLFILSSLCYGQVTTCPADKPIFENGNCRTRKAADCPDGAWFFKELNLCLLSESCGASAFYVPTEGLCLMPPECANNAIVQKGICRARVAADCTGATPIFENGNCRARVATDCTGNTPVLDNGNCRAQKTDDCIC